MNAMRPDMLHPLHPLANQQQNIGGAFSASTSRNAVLVSTAETAAQNECFTAWEPLRLRQEWTVC